MSYKSAKSIIFNNMQCSWSNYLLDLISEWSKNFVMIKNLHRFVNFYTSQFITKHGMMPVALDIEGDQNRISFFKKNIFFNCELAELAKL